MIIKARKQKDRMDIDRVKVSELASEMKTCFRAISVRILSPCHDITVNIYTV